MFFFFWKKGFFDYVLVSTVYSEILYFGDEVLGVISSSVTDLTHKWKLQTHTILTFSNSLFEDFLPQTITRSEIDISVQRSMVKLFDNVY